MMITRLGTIGLLLLTLTASRAAAAEDIAGRGTVDMVLDKTEAKAGDVIHWTVTLTINPTYHSYPMKQRIGESDVNTRFFPPKFGAFILVGDIDDPMPNASFVENGKTFDSLEG